MTDSTKNIRVVLVDDQTMIRQGLGYVIQMQPDMQVVGEASDGEEAVELVGKITPDVVLMDVQMPKKSGIEATREIMRMHPAVKVLILTTFDNHNYVVEGIRAGAVGYMLKDADSQEMLDLIRRASQGEALFHTVTAAKALAEALKAQPSVADVTVAPSALLDELTDRELDVLQQIAYGYRNDQIAQNLFISEGTVKTHVHRILQKMGVEDRTQAVAKALRLKIVK
ncbi:MULTISPECIES: response regulator [Brevibacillus]|jgi:DNA-binding NarL/FixJ family response regulator|uniref:Putative transcriptional regulatory protein YxjL n=1 Tax=Brevibacillus parabrevis TaxID=54914 RepID=A0A4Y3PPE8_BREPA|nr:MULTISPECIES: response regulator transcription factor [Brevibacillus]MBU8711177.1 response regulator transcription factor [Brevibacillus parabrevis]MDR4999650.1 response regulator transcription factor [Brevibacillus parabrevis]MED1721493.1 response regulator transcription factor [Brevibacillus parabrevis]MED2253788.1 response regulator transcription factor [Brevibacillus parabrevis]NRQ53877.1 response regulator transcription factor [Brevibacillus sp. HD1.4A]